MYDGKMMKKIISGLLIVLSGFAGFSAPTNDGMYATLQTTMGEVCFELYYTNVPQTVANFISLTEGTRPWIDPRDGFISGDPYYDGIIFHRVITNFMIQCGSPKGDGTDGPGYAFEDEFDPALRHDQPGIVSMANSGFDSNGGQFFITVTNTSHLDDKHSVFGLVVEGMNVVSNIAAVQVSDPGVRDRPLVDITITNAFITRNGTNALNFSVTNQSLPEVEMLPILIGNDNGIKVSTGTATSSYQYIYSSTNLTDWSEGASQYWPEEDGVWELAVLPESCEYFRANRVVYTPDTNMSIGVTNRYLVMTTIDEEEHKTVIQITPRTNDSGIAKYDDFTEDNIVGWEWDIEKPYRATLFVETDFPDAYIFWLHYSSPTNGRCHTYYNEGDGWQNLGTGTFSDQPAD